jgi:hypothetical protein
MGREFHVRFREGLGVQFPRATRLLVQVSQSAVCNCLHRVAKRYTCWLLMAHDHLGSDRLPLTLKFLSLMLTVRLASVSEATSALERFGGQAHRHAGAASSAGRRPAVWNQQPQQMSMKADPVGWPQTRHGLSQQPQHTEPAARGV